VLSNHDITRHATRYARLDRTGGGVADDERVRPDTPLDPELGLRRARAAVLLLLGLPGSAYVYQGEELGLPEVVDLPEEILADPIWERSGHRVRGRDGCRVPVPWEPDGPSLGFGSGEPWLPQPADWGNLSVQAQQGVDGSTLELYRSALRLRRELLAGGELEWLDSPAGSLVFRRRTPAGAVVCAVNLDAQAIDLPTYDRVLLSSVPLDDGHPLRLPGDAAVWLG
jgi:alpha-glucosidase